MPSVPTARGSPARLPPLPDLKLRPRLLAHAAMRVRPLPAPVSLSLLPFNPGPPDSDAQTALALQQLGKKQQQPARRTWALVCTRAKGPARPVNLTVSFTPFQLPQTDPAQL